RRSTLDADHQRNVMRGFGYRKADSETSWTTSPADVAEDPEPARSMTARRPLLQTFGDLVVVEAGQLIRAQSWFDVVLPTIVVALVGAGLFLLQEVQTAYRHL
ncbi:MAG: hypothetical protein SYR96_39460, partial [Actinomycetota bacterium]|nr:hypothetical protein [Actinomycetota bacterium]